MPKHEALTPKAIANRIKSKGLQKLRWYCQMCNKQCRDQNGFKCHLTSESHQRQLLLFAENSNKFVSDFSADFEKAYMDIVRRQFGTKRVHCNMVYHEYIKDRDHIHMNSTRWYTLTNFIQYLGRSGICKIDNTEKGWYLQYIDREEEERREKVAKKQKMDADDEERIMELVLKQAEKAQSGLKEAEITDEGVAREFQKVDDAKIEFKMPKTTLSEKSPALKFSSVFKTAQKERKKIGKELTDHLAFGHRKYDKPTTSKLSQKKSALDEIRESEEKRKEAHNRKDHWLHENIVVKIVGKKSDPKLYKQKAVVVEVVDVYAGRLRVSDDRTNEATFVELDQKYLETVIPALGKKILVVNGAYRGCKATLEKLDEKNFCVSIRIAEGPLKGRSVDNVQYEDICKLYSD